MANILLAEDDEQLRTMLKLVLELAGYEVTDAGDEALRRYRERSVDLVITDIIMADKDGLELIVELRRHDPLIKIIAISGGGLAVHSAAPSRTARNCARQSQSLLCANSLVNFRSWQ